MDTYAVYQRGSTFSDRKHVEISAYENQLQKDTSALGVTYAAIPITYLVVPVRVRRRMFGGT